MAKKKHNKDKKLHNSHELDLSWQETVDLQPEDELEGGSEIYYSVDEYFTTSQGVGEGTGKIVVSAGGPSRRLSSPSFFYPSSHLIMSR
jgi:hypothetical protein